MHVRRAEANAANYRQAVEENVAVKQQNLVLKRNADRAEKRAARFKAKDDNVQKLKKAAVAAAERQQFAVRNLKQSEERLAQTTEDRDKWKNR